MNVQGPGFIGLHLFWLFGFFVVVIVGIVFIALAVRALSRNTYPVSAPALQMGAAPPPPTRETPLEILARRFASGEITAEEYQRARDLLGGGGTS